MNKKLMLGFFILALSSLAMIAVPSVFARPEGIPRGSHDPVYIRSQDRYYDTIVPIPPTKGLPWNSHNTGSFQQLYPTGGPTGGLAADYGPGDPDYRGGRWWIDNGPGAHGGNGIQDFDDTYFLCPLLGGPVQANP